ncbi:hypothetical protein [Microtetraspora niveoalba]|uniref:hypothetical protein n=1 Tax=Microtetraspora niveoalba TaxID=46175 RepID=UPI00082FC26C|nr:hypothetical protein [Microtetraspora niveoalba]
MRGWVPAATHLSGAGESLVPGTPIEAMICGYPGHNTDEGNERHAGTRTLTGGAAAAMARDLAYLPVGAADVGSCNLKAGPMTNYLVRFTYPDGRWLWVGSADEVNACVMTTNGTASSREYIGDDITAAYLNGTWSRSRPEDPCRGPGGRRGQDTRMVPEGPTSVLVCWTDAGVPRQPRASYGRDVAEPLAAALNAAVTRRDGTPCRMKGSVPEKRTFRLIFGYPEGPPAGVWVRPGCDSATQNGLLEGDIDAAARQEVTRLAPSR